MFARLLRWGFGWLGVVLSVMGAIHVMGERAGLAFRLAMAGFFGCIALVCYVNVVQLRRVGWPIALAALWFVLMFAVRIVFGA